MEASAEEVAVVTIAAEVAVDAGGVPEVEARLATLTGTAAEVAEGLHRLRGDLEVVEAEVRGGSVSEGNQFTSQGLLHAEGEGDRRGKDGRFRGNLTSTG